MILLKKNTVNSCVFTLREKSLLWNLSAITPNYLFSITNQQTNKTINFVGTNISPLSAQSRYDEFLITETGSTYTNLSASTLNLSPNIFWEYKIYEQVNQYNFDIANTVSLVEYGRFYVSGATQFSLVSYSGLTGTNYITYKKS